MVMSKLLKRAENTPGVDNHMIAQVESALTADDLRPLVQLAYELDPKLGSYGPYKTTQALWSGVSPESLEALKDLFLAQGSELGSLIEENTDGSIPHLIAPSVLAGLVPYPNSFFHTCPIEVAVDAYFGLCYQPQREGTRFENGVKKTLIQRIKGSFRRCLDLMKPRYLGLGYMANVCTIGDEGLVGLYGHDDVQRWWDTIKDDTESFERRTVCGDAEFMLETLRERFGDGDVNSEEEGD